MVAHTTVAGSGAQNIQEKRELSLFSLEKKPWEESNCFPQPSKGWLERR